MLSQYAYFYLPHSSGHNYRADNNSGLQAFPPALLIRLYIDGDPSLHENAGDGQTAECVSYMPTTDRRNYNRFRNSVEILIIVTSRRGSALIIGFYYRPANKAHAGSPAGNATDRVLLVLSKGEAGTGRTTGKST